MVSRKSIGVVLAVGVGIAALALAYLASQYGRDSGTPSVSQRLYVDVDAGRESLPPGVHSKITPPADIRVDVTDAGAAGGPVKLAINAASLVGVSAATISVNVSEIGAESERTELLWSNAAAGFVAETVEYLTDPLPAGEYRFTAILEFVPDREGAKPLIVAETLYLDVRPDVVLSSAVSFVHIKRVELRRQLEEAGLAAAKGGLAKIKAGDPDTERRIDELNRIQDDVALDPAPRPAAGRNVPTHRGQPAPEVAVPVRPRNAQ